LIHIYTNLLSDIKHTALGVAPSMQCAQVDHSTSYVKTIPQSIKEKPWVLSTLSLWPYWN